MSLKTRTFRRVVLLGSLVAIILVIAGGYFFLRPMVAQHKLESMRTDGLAAAEAGDYQRATMLLGRYVSRNEDPDPETLLAYARARLKVQASDGGHVNVAIAAYRKYLSTVPDDVVASEELLPLFNQRQMYLEAKTLAQTLRTKYDDASIEVLREELIARRGLEDDAGEITALYEQVIASGDAAFQDWLAYTEWLRTHDREDDSKAVIAAQLEAHPDAVSYQLLAFWAGFIEAGGAIDPPRMTRLTRELASIIGLDPETNEWDSDPDFLTSHVVSFLDRFFNQLRRPDLSLRVRLASARINRDYESLVWSARRLYWTRDLETLKELNPHEEDGEPVADVIGYQILGLRAGTPAGDEAALLESLDSIVLDFRAPAWRHYLDGMELLKGGDSVKARPEVLKGLEMYQVEPMFHLGMGDVHAAQGRFNDARDEWLAAMDVSMRTVGNIQWLDPLLRVVNAYAQANRLGEGIDYVNSLVELAPQSPLATIIWLQSYASLARSGDLDRAKATEILSTFENARGKLSPEESAMISPQIATLYASVGRDDEARAVLLGAIATSPGQGALLEILDVDQRYELGVARESGIDTESLAASTPGGALQYALTQYATTQDADAGLAVLDQGAASADPDKKDDAYAWSLARARYLDTINDDRALGSWNTLRQANPDRVELLYQIAESNAMRGDLSGVNTLIDEIVNKTSTAGQTLPARLRLARAAAVIQQGQTRSNRDKALEIVRSVVAGEQQNIRARNMLGRLLSMKPSPSLDKADTFAPDYQGAINQYITISRQLKGNAGQNYLLEAVDLSFENNDEDSAKRYLLEFDARYPDAYGVLPEVARRFQNLNDLDDASAIYQRIYRNAQSADLVIDAGLSLIDMSIAQGQRDAARALLLDLSKEDSMSAEQLLKLASLHTKYGYKPEGDQLARSGERFGLDPIESKLVYARYAAAFVSSQAADAALREVIELDPENEEAWVGLARRLVRDREYEEAKKFISRAMERLPDNKELKALELLSQGDQVTASALLDAGVVESNDFVTAAVQRVDDYMKSKEDKPIEQRISMLTSMLDDFPEFSPILRFALSELDSMKIDPELLSGLADRAARQTPGDSLIMRIAGRAYLRADRPVDAMRISKLWRANMTGSPLEADLVAARAQILLANYAQASQILFPYLLGAIDSPEQLLSRDVLHAYSHAQLMQGESPSQTASRIEPLLAEHREIRLQVWLNLAVGSVPTLDEGAHWIEVVRPYASDEELPQIASAWISIMERFATWKRAYARAALDAIEPSVESTSPAPEDLVIAAQAESALAQSVDVEQERHDAYMRAVGYLERASATDPQNAMYIAMAARDATLAKEYAVAESKYRKILAGQLPPGPFRASVMNNQAMLIERQTDDPDRLKAGLDLISRSLAMFDATPFWGTKGWIELALGQLGDAELSFQHIVEAEPENIEGWSGLAIVQHRLGDERAEDSTRSFDRVLELSRGGGVGDELRERLVEEGAPNWASRLAP